ncbi:hypothetical protein [Chryseobacterium gambrini]|uniref:hypothetical protein n=1 Tax=Chryseobacterium gambrini TaxID=373672 RepID=UPI003D0C0637
MSKYVELARKIKALADKGIDGEKENAAKLLDSLMKKHNISMEDLEDEKIESFYFQIPSYKHELEYRILHQLVGIFKVKMYGRFTQKVMREYRLSGNYMIECSKVVYLEIKAKYDFYCARLEKRLDEFFYAFCMKNDLLVEPKNKEKKLSDEEIKHYVNAKKISMNMESDSFLKQIEQ